MSDQQGDMNLHKVMKEELAQTSGISYFRAAGSGLDWGKIGTQTGLGLRLGLGNPNVTSLKFTTI